MPFLQQQFHDTDTVGRVLLHITGSKHRRGLMFFIGFLSSMVLMLVVGIAIYRANARKKMPPHTDAAATDARLPSTNMDAWENNPLRKELANGNDSGSGRSSVQLTSADASQTLDNAAAKVSQLSKATAELQIAVQNQLPDGWFKHMDESTGRPFFVHTETGVTQWNLPVAEDEAAQRELEAAEASGA